MAIKSYFKCKRCLYAQDLGSQMFDGVILGIPPEEKEHYIDCHLNLNQLTDRQPEFNLKHCESVGCSMWACAHCGVGKSESIGSVAGHEVCW
jgi:hypothetical protein